ncbi:MAG: tripartite tricarboxylate transporter permease [Bacillota bacterium]
MDGINIHMFLEGLASAASPVNLGACFLGVVLGTLVGVLPGLGPTAAMSLMLPFSVRYGPEAGLIMLAGVWYGAMYGGSTTAILVNVPGEAASVATCLDGYQMARKGRAGAALALVALGSWVAGTIAVVCLQAFAPTLASVALSFGPSEFLALSLFCFVVLSGLIGESQTKGLTMLFLGLLLSTVGIDPLTGSLRFTFGSPRLMQGIDFIPVTVGIFGLAEVLRTLGVPDAGTRAQVRFRELYPSREEARRSVGPSLRGAAIGFASGLIPGPAPTVASFLSYSVERQISPRRTEFGTGMVEGVVGPESANNAAVIGAMAPLFGLGIPFSPTAAVLMAGLRMHDVDPGPMLFHKAPGIFWAFIAAMYLANAMLLVLNLPLVGVFARIATSPKYVLLPFVSAICLLGAYCVRFSPLDIWIMLAAGVIGFFLQRRGFPPAPLVVGMVLGPLAEGNFRLTVQLFRDQWWGPFLRPITLSLVLAAVVFQLVVVRRLRRHLVEG